MITVIVKNHNHLKANPNEVYNFLLTFINHNFAIEQYCILSSPFCRK